jgi:hypothetical protein
MEHIVSTKSYQEKAKGNKILFERQKESDKEEEK